MRFSLKLSAVFLFASIFVLCAGADAAAGNRALPELGAPSSAPTLGQTTSISLHASPIFEGSLVQYYVSYAGSGTTVLRVGNAIVVLPLGGAMLFDVAEVQNGVATGAFHVPNNPGLEGVQVSFVAVVMKGSTAIVTPVMPGGPILGDDLA